MAFPRMFMSPVPVLRSRVAGLFRTLRTETERTWTNGEALFASNGSTVSSTEALMPTLGLAVLVVRDDLHHFIVNLRGRVLDWDAYVKVHFSFKGNNRVSSAAHHAH